VEQVGWADRSMQQCLVNPFESQPRHDGPLWRFPMYANISVTLVGFPLAVARRALDEFTELARTKTRGPERLRIADDRLCPGAVCGR
jgi:hypothetical protein